MEKLLRRVYASRRATLTFKIVSKMTVVLSVLLYCLLLYLSFATSWQEGLAVLLSAAIPFFFVGLLRMWIDAPRPYELYDFYVDKPKEREGRSFPSRHAYSAFVIATLAIHVSPWLSIGAYLLALSLCISRVLLGIHFIRDVAAGALLGLAAGALGIVIMLI